MLMQMVHRPGPPYFFGHLNQILQHKPHSNLTLSLNSMADVASSRLLMRDLLKRNGVWCFFFLFIFFISCLTLVLLKYIRTASTLPGSFRTRYEEYLSQHYPDPHYSWYCTPPKALKECFKMMGATDDNLQEYLEQYNKKWDEIIANSPNGRLIAIGVCSLHLPSGGVLTIFVFVKPGKTTTWQWWANSILADPWLQACHSHLAWGHAVLCRVLSWSLWHHKKHSSGYTRWFWVLECFPP